MELSVILKIKRLLACSIINTRLLLRLLMLMYMLVVVLVRRLLLLEPPSIHHWVFGHGSLSQTMAVCLDWRYVPPGVWAGISYLVHLHRPAMVSKIRGTPGVEIVGKIIAGQGDVARHGVGCVRFGPSDS